MMTRLQCLVNVVLMTILLSTAPLAARATTYVYVSVTGEKRIAVYELDHDTGKLSIVADVAVQGQPGPLAIDPQHRFVFAAVRSANRFATYRFLKDSGKLEPVTVSEPRGSAAYLSTDQTGRFLFSAHYGEGKIGVHPIDDGGKLGEPVWTETADKAHSILIDKSNRFVFVPHTGPNAVFQFVFDAESGKLSPNEEPQVSPDEGQGPRHVFFHPTLDVVYTVNEQGGSVTGWKLDREQGRLMKFQTASTLPADFQEKNSCSDIEITPSGRFLFASNRGHDSIASFAIDPKTGKLSPLRQTQTEKTPRQFNIDPSGEFLIVAGQGNGRLSVYRINPKTGRLNLQGGYAVGGRPSWVLAVSVADADAG
ncbi:MAG: lactonase family protein [Planctomycetaceae bacterium]